MPVPSNIVVSWWRLVVTTVLIALVIVLLANAYDGRTSAEQQVRDIRAASSRRVDELLAENRQQAELNARLREALATIVAAHPDATVPPEVTTTIPPPATVPATTTTAEKPD